MSDSFGTLAPVAAPPRGLLAAVRERIVALFTVEVPERATEAQIEAAVTAPPDLAANIASKALEDRAQLPFREFGSERMPLEIANAGLVPSYAETILRIEDHMAGMPEADRGKLLPLLQSSNISHGMMELLAPDNPLERVAYEWTMNGVGDKAADRMLDAATEVVRVGEWPGRDTALTEQPFGLHVIDARQEWSNRVVQIDRSEMDTAEKANRIEALGVAPVPGSTVLKDNQGQVYQRDALADALRPRVQVEAPAIDAPGIERGQDGQGQRITQAREAWDQAVLAIDGSDRPAAVKAQEIEALGAAPGLGVVGLTGDGGQPLPSLGLDRATDVAEADVEQGLEQDNVKEISVGAWHFPAPEAEYRINTGISAEGFHTEVEVGRSGASGDAVSHRWSEPFDTRDAAMDHALDQVDRMFVSHEVEQAPEQDLEVGGYEL